MSHSSGARASRHRGSQAAPGCAVAGFCRRVRTPDELEDAGQRHWSVEVAVHLLDEAMQRVTVDVGRFGFSAAYRRQAAGQPEAPGQRVETFRGGPGVGHVGAG